MYVALCSKGFRVHGLPLCLSEFVQFFLVNYTGYDEGFNEIIEKETLRPVNPKFVSVIFSEILMF